MAVHCHVVSIADQRKSPISRYSFVVCFSDVCRDDEELVAYVYDRGNRLPNGDDRFLGMVKLKPSLQAKRTTDHWYKLEPRADAPSQAYDGNVTGELRLQLEYSSVGPVSRCCGGVAMILN